METSHKSLIAQLAEQFAPVLASSTDGVYLWLDEEHKICNERLAHMFGLSVEDWCAQQPFLTSFIAPADRERYARNYQSHVADLSTPVTFRFTGVRQDGTTFAAETDMIPLSISGHAVAYHFVREIQED